MLCRASVVDEQSFAKSVMSWLRDPDEAYGIRHTACDGVGVASDEGRVARAKAWGVEQGVWSQHTAEGIRHTGRPGD